MFLPFASLLLFLSPSTSYEKWLGEEVKYIISAREQEEFERLETQTERERFIEEFWKRRDPDPSTTLNEFQEEHYRRIRYANERFGNEGRPGWKTPRGQTYIIHGPPDSVSYSYGYLQRVSVEDPTRILNPQGEAVPFIYVEFPTPESETWVYHHLPGANSTRTFFTVIFAKLDPLELYFLQKAIQRVPVSSRDGSSESSSLEMRLNRDRTIKEFITKQSYFRNDYRVVYAGAPHFRDLEDLLRNIFQPRGGEIDQFSINEATADLLRSPGELLEIQRRRRERMEELVRSRVYYESLALEVGFGFLRYLQGQVRIPVHAQISIPPQGARPEELELWVDLLDPRTEKTVALFQDTVHTRGKKASRDTLSYHSRLTAPPGDYRLRLVVSDLENKRIGLWEQPLVVPNLDTPEFEASQPLICEDVFSRAEFKKLAQTRSGRDWIIYGSENPLAFDEYVFVPSATRRFRRGQNLTTLLEVYNPTLESKKPQVEIQATFERDGHPVFVTHPATLDYRTGEGGDLIIYAFTVPLQRLDLGPYDFVVKVTDTPTGRTTQKRTGIKIW